MATESDELMVATEALAPFADGLDSDGYSLIVESITPDVMAVRIDATSAACADCLVPKGVMEAMLKDLVSDALAINRVEVTYPTEPAH